MDICEYFFRVEVEEEKDWMEVQVEEKDGGVGKCGIVVEKDE